MTGTGRVLLGLMPLAVLIPTAAAAQDFSDAQVLTNRVLFAKEDAAAVARAAERRRIEALDARAARQEVLLQEQARSVQQLGGELQLLRDERQLIDLADAFDAALAAGRWAAVRAMLANEVAVDLGRASALGAGTVPADALIEALSGSLGRGGVLPRSNQRVSFATDRATVTADGYAWGRPGRSAAVLADAFGRYEYQFARTAEGWRIVSLAFRPAPPT